MSSARDRGELAGHRDHAVGDGEGDSGMCGALHAVEHQEHRGEIENHHGQQHEEDAPPAAVSQFRAALQDLVFEVGLDRHNHVNEDQAHHGDDAWNHQERSP